MFTLVVWSMLMIFGVPDPGIVRKVIPSPTLIPARAANPPVPLTPPAVSPVVHCINPSAYKNPTNDCNPLVMRRA